MEKVFKDSSQRIAEELGLKGIMDVEAIVSDHVPRILEIDARIPSQTPITVMHSTGINMVGSLVDLFTSGELKVPAATMNKVAYYEHIVVKDGIMRSCGEGIFSGVRKPQVIEGLFGSDEMSPTMCPERMPGQRPSSAPVRTPGPRTRKEGRS